MPKPSSGSNRYLKAQLRPLTKPVFWASAGLFGLSLFALFSLFHQPDAVLSNGDRDAIVNLDENDSLTPEERARAAEIDDLSVLLKDLDKSKTIDSVSGRLNDAQTTNLEAPEAIADLDSSNPPPSSTPSTSGDFQQLPLLDLSPQTPTNSSSLQTSGSGFIGFDPRSSSQVNGTTSSQITNGITPLAAALENNSTTANSAINTTAAPNGTSPAMSSTASPSGQRTGALSNGVQPNGSPAYSAPTSMPTPAAPTYNNLQGLTPQNSSSNAYSQLLNPNLIVPAAPLSPAAISPFQPAPAAPATFNYSLGQAQSTGQINSQSNGSLYPSNFQTTQTPIFGAPSNPTTAPRPSNPAPYSIPNATPGRYGGNGQINTFANP